MTTLLSPDPDLDLSLRSETATSLTQLAGGSAVPVGPERPRPVPPAPGLRARWARLDLRARWARLHREAVLVTTTLWLAGRLAALALARVIGWFAAEPRRIRVALAGVAVAAAIGIALGAVVGMVLAGCWALLRAHVLADLR